MEKGWHRPNGKGLSAPRKVADSMEKNTLMSRGQRVGSGNPLNNTAAQLATANAGGALPE